MQGRFAQAALAAQEVQSSERPQPLHGKKVYVHVADAAKKGPSTGNGGPLRRLVAALGGKVCIFLFAHAKSDSRKLQQLQQQHVSPRQCSCRELLVPG